MKREENIAFYKDGKPRVRPCYCKPETDKKYDDMPCDYGWHTSNRFFGAEIGKLDKNGKHIRVGDWVKNDKVAGIVSYYEEPCQFRVKVESCKYAKDINSIDIFYPTYFTRDEQVKWEVWDGIGNLNEWCNTFKKETKNGYKRDEGYSL